MYAPAPLAGCSSRRPASRSRGLEAHALSWTQLPSWQIHSGEQCTGDAADPFAAALGHYDPDGCPHPEHAGDLPPLFSTRGYAFQVFLTDRFSLHEIVGRTVIIHSSPDDFTSQPSGNAGTKIACGRIRTR